MTISIDDAVDLLFHGRSNVPNAAKKANTEPEVLKQLLLEKIKTKPEMAPLQLTLPFI